MRSRRTSPDRLPAPIGDTLGANDVAHVFVHDVGSFARLEGYSYGETRVTRWTERALVMARPHDVVCVFEPVEDAFLAYLSGLGIGPRPHHVVALQRSAPPSARPLAEQLAEDGRALDTIRDLVAGARQVVLDPFIATTADFRLAAALGAALGRDVTVLGGHPDVVERANRKDHTRATAVELGVPIARGDVVALPAGADGRPTDLGPLETALARRVGATGRALVRGAWGASGSATFVVEAGRDHIQAALRKVGARVGNRVYLVDSMHDVRVSPNLLMHLPPEGGPISWVGVSDQQLDAALVHRGNLYPSRARTLADMVASAQRLARGLQGEGVVGLVGFDFCEYRDRDTGKDEHFLAEVNARVNGAAYPAFLLDWINREQARRGRPPVGAFLSVQTLVTRAGSFAEFAARHPSVLFDPVTGRGCVPFNTGQLVNRTCSGAFLGETPADVMAMHEAWRAAEGRPGAASRC